MSQQRNDQKDAGATIFDGSLWVWSCECGDNGQPVAMTDRDAYWVMIEDGHLHQERAHDAVLVTDHRGRTLSHRFELKWKVKRLSPVTAGSRS